MERYDEEEEKAKEEYEKHKCKGCVWARWQTPYIVSCLFPRCMKDSSRFMVDKLSVKLVFALRIEVYNEEAPV
jgi:hypothetical protein